MPNKHKVFVMIVPFVLAFSAVTSSAQDQGYDPEARLAELGITLRKASSPVANYVNAVRTGDLLYLSGKGPLRPDGTLVIGKVGADLSVEEGYEAARLVGIQLISTMKDELGDLSRVRRIVKALGMVNASPDFGDHPAVINGFSDLMVEVFGDRGRHARSAIGMGSLPDNIAVEIEVIVEVDRGSLIPCLNEVSCRIWGSLQILGMTTYTVYRTRPFMAVQILSF